MDRLAVPDDWPPASRQRFADLISEKQALYKTSPNVERFPLAPANCGRSFHHCGLLFEITSSSLWC
jgi:hypothetical protein